MNAWIDLLRGLSRRDDVAPLGAMDLFHVFTDAELRAEAAGHNVCAVAVWLDGRADVSRLRARLAEVPELTWRLSRHPRHGWCWRSDGPGPRVDERDGELTVDDLAALVTDGATLGRPFRLQIWRGAEGDAVALAWHHAVSDAKGAGRLLAWLGSDAPLPAKRHATSDRVLAKLDPVARRELTQAYVEHVFEVGGAPILSLRRTSRGPAGEPRPHRVHLTAEQTARFDASLRRRAGLADTSLLLWASARLADRLLRERGYAPFHHVVPLPLSLDPKKGSARMFGNHLTMMLTALDRDDLADEARAVRSLAEQRRAVVRQKLDVAMVAAVKATGWMPWRVVDHVSRRPFGGERSSLVVSNPGDLGLERFEGHPVRDALAIPTVLTSPGLQVTADRHQGRMSVLVMVRDGLVAPGEIEAQLPALVDDLLGS